MRSSSTVVFRSISFDLFKNLQLQPQRLQDMLRVRELLPLELHLTLQPGNTHKHTRCTDQKQEKREQLYTYTVLLSQKVQKNY